MSRLQGTLTPFLYPCLEASYLPLRRARKSRFVVLKNVSFLSTVALSQDTAATEPPRSPPTSSHLDPPPEDYARTIFADKCRINLHAGSGGHGSISFLREKYVPNGPANGGDGGSGGNIYIQAVRGETSLHKLARRGILKAGRGRNGQGKNKGGQRGNDVLVQVPIGTVVREIIRHDPVAEEEERLAKEERPLQPTDGETRGSFRRDKWMLYPSSLPSEYANAEFPPLPKPRKSNLTLSQPPAPIILDLSKPMEQPLLLAAGAVGGLGNPHFVTRDIGRPKFATKGEHGMTLTLDLELKLIADVAFVGLPNAGKSTLLRALTRSRARVGDWAFTTLQPNIGTVVLDDSHGRPKLQSKDANGEPRTQISIADIPGLIPDAHLDRGLGLGFLRHIERARVLAFVVDLSAGDPVEGLKSLWHELGEFENLKGKELNEQTEHAVGLVDWKAMGRSVSSATAREGAVSIGTEGIVINPSGSQALPMLEMPPLTSKPWFVVATKADLAKTQENFQNLQAYLDVLSKRLIPHPSGRKHCWQGKLCAIPVSAITGGGVDKIPEWTVGLFDD